MNNIEITNQDAFEIRAETVEKIVLSALSELEIDNSFLQVSFVTEEAMHRLNREYRSVDRTTDVLSFPQVFVPGAKPRILGDIVISPTYTQSKGESLEDVLKHGLLHLLGYDHETDLAKWETEAKKINSQY